jgi:hypothetical protein
MNLQVPGPWQDEQTTSEDPQVSLSRSEVYFVIVSLRAK